MSNSIVDRINEENRKKHGDIQECCGLFKDYCRCDTKITPIPLDEDHSLDEVTKWFRKKLMEAAEIPSDKKFIGVRRIKPTTLGLELPTLDRKTGRLKWSFWQREFWEPLKFWK